MIGIKIKKIILYFQLDKVKKDTDLCFSFGKGQRTLVYVKMNDTYKSIDIDTLKSST